MTATRENVEAVLISRCGGIMPLAGMAVTLSDNPDLNDPIGYALRRLGYDVLDMSSVSNSDLAPVEADDINPLLDLAELRVLDTWLGRYTLVDIEVGDRSEKLGQLAKQVKERAAMLRKSIDDIYGLDASSVDEGAVVMDFAEHFEDAA